MRLQPLNSELSTSILPSMSEALNTIEEAKPIKKRKKIRRQH
jgi:hypothetical protein